MPSAAPASPSRLEIYFVAACVSFALVFSLVDINLWHPGAAWPDEFLTNLKWPQEWREGMSLPMSYPKGCLHRLALTLCGVWPTPSLSRLHLPTLAAFFGENLALYFVVSRRFNERAALWAMGVNAIAAFTLLRLRSLLSYSVTPFELLGMMALLPYAQKSWKAGAWGFGAAILLLDYEAWALAIPVLALFWLSEDGPRPRASAALAGFALGLALVAGLSWRELVDHVAFRSGQSFSGGASTMTRLTQSLKGYWLGAPALPYAGVSDWPVFPLVLLPSLALGLGTLRRKGLWVTAWLLLGFVPLVSANSAAEPQRMIVAWPALCVAAGLGFEWTLRTFPWARFGLIVLMLGAIVLEGRAYARSMNAAYKGTYGLSIELRAAARRLAAAGHPWNLLTEFDNESAAAIRFVMDEVGVKRGVGAPVAAIIPWEYAYGLEAQGTVTPHVFFPLITAESRFKAIDAELGKLWKSLPRFEGGREAAMAMAYLDAHPTADPWIRSACIERALGQSLMKGERPDQLLKYLESEPLQSASALLWAAARLRTADPAFAVRLEKRALAIDPRLASSEAR